MPRMKFMNTEIDNITMAEAVERIDELIQEDKNAYIVTPNVDVILQLQKDEELLRAYRGAALILTDGHPLIWISRLYGTPIREKIAGSDLFPKLCELAAKRGYTMFFLGAPEGVAVKAAEKLQKKLPGLQVVGTYSPPYGFENDEAEVRKIVEMIKSAQPQMLIIALGTPKQERFIMKHRDEMNVPFSVGLGATLNFEAGTVKRAPKWMTNHGLEWIWRAAQERRLIKRYAMNLLRLPGLVIKYWPESPPPQSVILLNLSTALCLYKSAETWRTVKAFACLAVLSEAVSLSAQRRVSVSGAACGIDWRLCHD